MNNNDIKYYQYEEKVINTKDFMNEEDSENIKETNKIENIKLDMNYKPPKKEFYNKNQFFLPNKNQKYSNFNLIENENNLNNDDLQNNYIRNNLENNLKNNNFKNLQEKNKIEDKNEDDKIFKIKNLLEEIQQNLKEDKEEEKNSKLAHTHDANCPVHGHLVRNNPNMYIPPPYIVQMENQNKINHMSNYEDQKFIPPQPLNPEFYNFK